MDSSLSWLVSLPTEERAKRVRELTPQQALGIRYSWPLWARPNQRAPRGDWITWLILAGRGNGKTRSGAEWTLEREADGARRIALVGRTEADVRDVMVEGESGILERSPPWHRPKWFRSQLLLVWPRRRGPGGSLLPAARAKGYSAEKPAKLRGPQHDTAWCDELAAWQYPESWDQLQFGLRLGQDPRACITTTPRPTPDIKALLKDPTVAVTRGSTYDNRENLPKAFFDRILRKYEGTRLGRQELDAEVLDDNPNALWHRDNIDSLRLRCDALGRLPKPDLRRVMVAVDIAVADLETKTAEQIEDVAETGIIVFGLGHDGHGYVLADLSGKFTPPEWAKIVVKAFDDYKANDVVCEANQGGALIKSTLRTVRRSLPVRLVHASRGKHTRAEPIGALYEQGRVHHVGSFPELEDQMCSWEPGQKSPDRMDALVWAATKLMVSEDPAPDRSRASIEEAPDFDAVGVGM